MSSLTREHYLILARSIADAFDACNSRAERQGVERVRDRLIHELEADNPSFSGIKFLNASDGRLSQD